MQQIGGLSRVSRYICLMKRVDLYTLLSLIALVILIACGDGPQTQDPVSEPQQLDTLRYGDQAYNFPDLNTTANNLLTDWPIFLEFRAAASNMHSMRLEGLKTKLDLLQAHTDSMLVQIPDTLNTPAIESRLRIVSTRVHLLRQEANKQKVLKPRIENEIDETNEAIKNLFVQINEKIEKDAIDRSRSENEKAELQKQQRFRDSIYQLELQDQNN